jgi:hypothetical protein
MYISDRTEKMAKWHCSRNVCLPLMIIPVWMTVKLTTNRLEKASSEEELSQETIIQNLDPKEAHRLSRVRNIGIAVCYPNSAFNAQF